MSDARRLPGLAELRAEFDAAFAAAPQPDRPALVALLAARVGGDSVAFRVLDIAGLLQARPIVPLPSARPDLLGLCAVRGAVVPVLSLARLLGRPEDPGAPRWIVLAGPPERRVALAIASLEGHLVVPTSELRRSPPGETPAAHVAEIARRGEALIPVVNVPSVLRALTDAHGE